MSVGYVLHNLGEAAEPSTTNPGPIGLGVADEPDEALIDRGHPSHASHVMKSMCRADPVAGCSPSVCVGGKLQILFSSPPLILLALTCVVSVAPPVGGADAREGQDGIEVNNLEGGRRQEAGF